jgi:VWFA-related protein
MSMNSGTRLGQTLRTTAAVTVCVLAPMAVLDGQPPSRVERVDVARVVIDARVIADDGQAIRGLTPADFTVTIGGQRVDVESVQWIGGQTLGRSPLPTTPLAGVVEPAAPGRLIVFVVQKSLSGHRLAGLLRVLQQSGELFAGLTADDRVAILSFDSYLKVWLDFTDDLDRARTVLADHVMFREHDPVEPAPGLSLVPGLGQDRARETYTIEGALRLLGQALEPLPGSKSVVLIGYGFGRLSVTLGSVGAVLEREYYEARDALQAARAAVFSLDVTDADYHTFEHGLETVSVDTGGFFARMHLFPKRSIGRVASALTGHYVLITRTPELDAGTHRIEVELVNDQGAVFARSSYSIGEGVPQDEVEAVRWYRLAAEQGDARAQGNLGVMYGNGSGVPLDYVAAHMWSNLAAAGSSGDDRDLWAKNRDIIAAKMTAEQVVEAQRRAREWTPTTPKS